MPVFCFFSGEGTSLRIDNIRITGSLDQYVLPNRNQYTDCSSADSFYINRRSCEVTEDNSKNMSVWAQGFILNILVFGYVFDKRLYIKTKPGRLPWSSVHRAL